MDDVHFYMICWARIDKLSAFIGRETRYRQVGLVRRRYRAELDDATDLRDHLEHFEERLPGGKKASRLKKPNDLYNMWGDRVSMGGRFYDVSQRNLAVLRAFVRELKAALAFDSIDTLLDSDLPRLRRHFRRAHSDVAIQKLLRRLARPAV